MPPSLIGVLCFGSAEYQFWTGLSRWTASKRCLTSNPLGLPWPLRPRRPGRVFQPCSTPPTGGAVGTWNSSLAEWALHLTRAEVGVGVPAGIEKAECARTWIGHDHLAWPCWLQRVRRVAGGRVL